MKGNKRKNEELTPTIGRVIIKIENQMQNFKI